MTTRARMRKVGLETQRLEQERRGLEEDATLERKRRAKAMSLGTLVSAVDAAIGRDADDDGHYYAASTFAVVWAAIGYVVWVSMTLMWRVSVALFRLVFRRNKAGVEATHRVTWKETR